MPRSSRPLGVIPAFLRTDGDAKVLVECLESIQQTAAKEIEVIVVDDGSPNRELVERMDELQLPLRFELWRKPENTGFSRTVNVGLRRALEEGRDAVLINADIEFASSGWVKRMVEQPGMVTEGPASVVGALLLFPNGLIQHGGVYFSLLTRTFDHLYKYGPWNLPEALEPDVRPVTGALQFIRHECLETVGLYDERFRMGWEDVDYCLRVFLSGRECVYQPAVRAFHHEMMFRGRADERLQKWQAESFVALMQKYAGQSFAGLVPTL